MYVNLKHDPAARRGHRGTLHVLPAPSTSPTSVFFRLFDGPSSVSAVFDREGIETLVESLKAHLDATAPKPVSIRSVLPAFLPGARRRMARTVGAAPYASRVKVVSATATEAVVTDLGTNFPAFRFEGEVTVPADALVEIPAGDAAIADQGYLPKPIEAGSFVEIIADGGEEGPKGEPRLRHYFPVGSIVEVTSQGKTTADRSITATGTTRSGSGVLGSNMQFVRPCDVKPAEGPARLPRSPEPAPAKVIGSKAIVTGDTGEAGHDFPDGAIVTILTVRDFEFEHYCEDSRGSKSYVNEADLA